MKKILSLTLAVLMVVSMIPTAFAAETYTCAECGATTTVLLQDCCYDCAVELGYINTGKSYTTVVTYTADAAESYEVTVPATLAPGESGKVYLSGAWDSTKCVIVTADESAVLTNSISGGDTKTLAVSFEGIALDGSNTESVSAEETVSVAPIEDALFGTWTGKFNYYVEVVEPEIQTLSFTMRLRSADDTITIAETVYNFIPGMTWSEWVNSEYNTGGFILNYNASPAFLQGINSSGKPSAVSLNSAYCRESDTIMENAIYDYMEQEMGSGD